MRMQALSIHTSTEQPKDADWAHIVLDFLKAYVEDMGAELLMDVDDHKAYVTGLIESLRHAASELQAGWFECCRSIMNSSERSRLSTTRHTVPRSPCAVRHRFRQRSSSSARSGWCATGRHSAQPPTMCKSRACPHYGVVLNT